MPHHVTVYRPRRRRRRLVLSGLALVVVMVGVLGTGAWLARAEPGTIPPDITIGGVAVGGLTVDEARSRVLAAESRRTERPISVVYNGGELETSPRELGAAPDVDAALDEALEARGALGRLWARLGFADVAAIPLAFTVDQSKLGEVVDRIERELEREAVPASVELVGLDAVAVPSRSGVELDRRAATESLAALPERVELVLSELPPAVGDEAAERAALVADELLTTAPAVVSGKLRFAPEPELLARALRFDEHEGEIALSLDPSVVEAPLRQVFGSLELAPEDASWRIEGDRAILLPARKGRNLDVERIAAELIAHPGASEVKARFAVEQPELTTRRASRMGIRQLVSEFTTAYPCCAPRVANIQRAAEILDGTIVKAGARFSLNARLGERTKARGFVAAPQIYDGRLEDAVGGGVSQVATTFFNAAFFAGLALIQHTPHQFYISRYPMGREATISWGGPELVFRNDWPAAILVKVTATDTSITVRFFSSRLGRRVETETGEPYDLVAPQVIREPNPDLPAGQEEVVQDGGVEGFSVDYTRRVYRGKELRRDERFHVDYDAQNTIVEVGTGEVQPTS